MIEWVDAKLIALAKKLIQVAAFFGISRKQVLINWVIIASIFCMWPARGTSDFTDIILSMCIAVMFGTFLAMMIFLPRIIASYREDDTMSNDLLLRNQRARLFFLGLWPLITYLGIYFPQFHGSIRIWLLLPKLINVYFWPYIVLNQDHLCKMTAKDWLKTAARALKPKPIFQPSPQPVPVRSFQSRV